VKNLSTIREEELEQRVTVKENGPPEEDYQTSRDHEAAGQ
jgi:hypothetical protein